MRKIQKESLLVAICFIIIILSWSTLNLIFTLSTPEKKVNNHFMGRWHPWRSLQRDTITSMEVIWFQIIALSVLQKKN